MKPSAYPEKTENVTLAQTHISNVFIGDTYVYKIKKSVNFGFLDFSTLEKRKYYCNQEITLNNRFSQGVYLDVIPVTFDGAKYAVAGDGETVEYAVKMKRLSDDDLLKSKFKKGDVSSDDLQRIGRAIADFHKRSEKSKEIDKFGTLEVIKFNTDENFQQTEEFVGNSILKKQYQDLKKWTDEFYKNHEQQFKQRIQDGKIRDCHGDLHMEHICLTDPIIIFDCIEFNERFRYSDIASDIAFLLMDIEYNGDKKLADELCEFYLKNTNETDNDFIYKLIKFYKVYRAYVRGKVTSFILNDTSISDDKKDASRKIAQKYFTLAHSYISD